MAKLCFSRALLFLFLSFTTLQSISITCTQFEVGGKDGWTVPEPKNGDVYSQWASRNRFQVNDTIHFKYKDDSILVVTNEEYSECRSSDRPISYANNGDTIITLDRPGNFYFISGISEHCDRGMKMIIRVLEPHHHPSPPPDSHDSTKSSTPKTTTTVLPMIVATLMVFFSVVVLI